MAAELHVELVAADRRVWSGEATLVVARTTSGDIGVMPGHQPLLGVLESGPVTIRTSEGGNGRRRGARRFHLVRGQQAVAAGGDRRAGGRDRRPARRAGAGAREGGRPTPPPSGAPMSGCVRWRRAEHRPHAAGTTVRPQPRPVLDHSRAGPRLRQMQVQFPFRYGIAVPRRARRSVEMVLALTVCGVVVALALVGLFVFGLRRRLIQRSGGTFDCSLRWNVAGRDRAHAARAGCTASPATAATGSSGSGSSPTPPAPAGSWSAPRSRCAGRRAARGRGGAGAALRRGRARPVSHRGTRLELAMSEDALTGFLAWLEAAPPGQRVNVA